jgi:hypothetical protein
VPKGSLVAGNAEGEEEAAAAGEGKQNKGDDHVGGEGLDRSNLLRLGPHVARVVESDPDTRGPLKTGPGGLAF